MIAHFAKRLSLVLSQKLCVFASLRFALKALFLLCVIGIFASRSPAADVLTQRNDNFRSGLNLSETKLTPAAVKSPGAFGKLYSRHLDANAYAQPLYVSHLDINGKKRNVIFVATEHNSVYAFEDFPGDPNPNRPPLWQRNLGPSIPTTTLDEDFHDDPPGCTDLTTEIGITSTPVIDRARNLIYVEAKTKSHGQYAHTLFALDLRTGEIVHQTPIQATVVGRGIGSEDGKITFQPAIQHNRPGLLLDHGRIYIAFASHCDTGDFHGWLFAYDAADLKLIDVFITTPNTTGKYNGEGGIWQSGAGPSADEQGNVYVEVANGGYDPNVMDFGNSVLKLALVEGKFKLRGWFTPTDEEVLKIQDCDLGSCAPLVIPGTDLLIAAGKEGIMYLLDRAAMNGQVAALQEIQVTPGPYYFGPATNYGSVRYWNLHGMALQYQTPAGRFFYICGEEDPIRVFRLMATNLPGGFRFDPPAPYATSDERAAYPPERAYLQNPPVADPNVWMPGGFLALSANGHSSINSKSDNAILWALMPLDGNANGRVVNGVLRAFDPAHFIHRADGSLRIAQLWSSDHDQNKSSDSLGMFPKFVMPTIANGHVIVTSFNEETIAANGLHYVKQDGDRAALVVYGLKSKP
jgi:hypothetical protein